jgi:hypothetical protein
MKPHVGQIVRYHNETESFPAIVVRVLLSDGPIKNSVVLTIFDRYNVTPGVIARYSDRALPEHWSFIDDNGADAKPSTESSNGDTKHDAKPSPRKP